MKITDGLKKFKVIRCKKCQIIGISEAFEIYKCKSCGKTTKMSMKPKGLLMTHLGVDVLYHANTGNEARLFYLKLQEEQKRTKDVSFFTYKKMK